MKTFLPLLVSALLCLNSISANAQPGGMGGGSGPRGTQFSGSLARLFGEHRAFSATLENQIKSQGQEMSVPGKVAYDNGKSRFEMDMSDAKGSQMRPETIAQIKAMGMERMTMISRPDQKLGYMIYPGLESYAAIPIQDPDVNKPDSAFKVEMTELGKVTIDGHPTVKNKAVVTDDSGQKKEFTIWNATDLKKFPIKIETTEQGNLVTMVFKDLKLEKPDAAQFDPPAAYKKYTDMNAMMQEMMKRMRPGMGGTPPAK